MIEVPATRRAPWEAEPHRLWSLLDMLRFYAMHFTTVVATLEQAVSAILLETQAKDSGDSLNLHAVETARSSLAELSKAITALPVSQTVKSQATRAMGRMQAIELKSDADSTLALTVLNELKFNVINDLSSHLCLMVPDGRRGLFEQLTPPFGEAVAGRFPEAGRDIAAACRCLALDEWTAAVFHLMRVLEHGLRDLAARLTVTFPGPIELEQWKNIIDKIVSKIRDMEQLPKSKEKSEDLKFYNIAASQFWHFKEAWRNHVSHSREHYDERDAMQVFNAVRDFMQKLAERF